MQDAQALVAVMCGGYMAFTNIDVYRARPPSDAKSAPDLALFLSSN